MIVATTGNAMNIHIEKQSHIEHYNIQGEMRKTTQIVFVGGVGMDARKSLLKY